MTWPEAGLEANAMTVTASKNETNQRDGTAEATQRFARLALILSLSILGVAVTYFGALYLIAR
jgi:hypothetical protein